MLINQYSSSNYQVNLQPDSASLVSSTNLADKFPNNTKPLRQKAEEKDRQNSSESSAAEQRTLQQLKNRDREVRAHEQAHLAAGGRYITSAANFNYQRGPDGKQYAVSGEVSIDTASVPGDPEATLRKARVVAHAALAPVDPSAKDRHVAAKAVAMMQQARVELAVKNADTKIMEKGSNLDTFA